MQCDYFDAGACRSCRWMGRPYATQLATLQEHAADRLSAWSGLRWLAPFSGPEQGFRNKAKMVVGGTVAEPTLGILDPVGAGTDLRHCWLHEPLLHDALPALAAFVTRAGLQPYDVPARRGELKHVVATVSPDGELMVRWVLRSTEPLARLRKHLPWLQERLPGLVVASANLQPEHKAVLEGPEEVLLTEQTTLSMRLAGLDLRLRPQGFFQTNSAVAAALYEQAGGWIAEAAPDRVLDLYCGVGGFALTAARVGVRDVVGVEVSPEAVAGATAAAARTAESTSVRFVVGDVTAPGLVAPGVVGPDLAALGARDLVVVNPPRRGIGSDLAGRLEASRVGRVLYSSCHVDSLLRDLTAMPSLAPVRARVFDMFPQTAHAEVLVLLERHRGEGGRVQLSRASDPGPNTGPVR